MWCFVGYEPKTTKHSIPVSLLTDTGFTMSQQSSAVTPDTGICDELEGTDCYWCDGRIIRDTYKDNPAVVCTDCGTPAAVQFGD